MAKQEWMDRMIAKPGKKISLADFDPGYIPKGFSKETSRTVLREGVAALAKLQEMLYAQNTHALLIVLQAMDAAGKDGVIEHVMSGINPQGCQVYSFKAPSAEELDHDYLWRCTRALPERGRIGIFNRSYYEEVLVVRVHPEFLERQQIPEEFTGPKIWKHRFEEINNFEKYLVRNGIHVLKFFLNVSRDEQKRRFLARLDTPEKNWKFSAADARERGFWKDYMAAYQDMLRNTSTKWAPWYVIPADNKWVTRVSVAAIIGEKLESLNLRFPAVDEKQMAELTEARRLLEAETEPEAKAEEKSPRQR